LIERERGDEGWIEWNGSFALVFFNFNLEEEMVVLLKNKDSIRYS